MIDFILNSNRVSYKGDSEVSLLSYLRDEINITSPKDGCSPQAACGCCVVHLDGKPVLACVKKMMDLEGKVVLTLEGISEYRKEVFANSFVNGGGLQCGFCIPGIVMQADALIGRNANPSRVEVEKALTPNLCRCTGYKKIVDSIMNAADAIRNEEEIELLTTKGNIGESHPRYKGKMFVLGTHEYTDDIRLNDMLHGALRFSDHPRAVVKSIDCTKALLIDGVVDVVTAADVIGERYLGLIKNDWPIMVDVGETTCYIGDVIAGVIACDENTARLAVAKIEIEYDVLKPVENTKDALLGDSEMVHSNSDTNLLSKTVIKRGDAYQARRSESKFCSSGIYETQRIEHGFMEPECAIAFSDNCVMNVFSQGQGVYEDRAQIARMLGVREREVEVYLISNGGAFGGKEDLSVQGHAALFASKVKRPVKVRLNREESIIMHPKRHPVWMDYDVGCDSDGMLTYVKAKFVGDTGAYASVGMKVMERCAGHATGGYHVPNVDIESLAVYTNNIPSGAMRGFGVNQATFGIECCIDELCEQGGFDRWQFRYDNALVTGSMTATGQVLGEGVGMRATLEAVKETFHNEKIAGIACGVKNTGIGNGMPEYSEVSIVIEKEGIVNIKHGWTEMGQGVNTVAIQALCHETGIDPDCVEVVVDTTAEHVTGMTTASRATSLMCNAIINACDTLKLDINKYGLDRLEGKEYTGKWGVDWTTKLSVSEDVEQKPHYSYSYATQVVLLDEDGYIKKIVAAHDAGRIFNPTLFEGQIEGSIHMGLGYAISEDLPMTNGKLDSSKLRHCGILRAKEMPEMEIIGVEVPDPYGPYGGKGVGEIGLVPTAAAVANALYMYDGYRRTNLPMECKVLRRK